MKKKKVEQVKKEISRRSFLLQARNVGAAAAVIGLGASMALGSGCYDDYADYTDGYLNYGDYSDGYSDGYLDGYSDYSDYSNGYSDYSDYSNSYLNYGDYGNGYSDSYLDSYSDMG